MIHHTVFFTLSHPIGSPQEASFMEQARTLTQIPAVTHFEILKQISPKCDYTYGISMIFTTQAELDDYTSHPLHTAFVQNHWIPNVTDFQEIDYTPLSHDRGRNDALICAAPPSEPCVRISRTRLSGQCFTPLRRLFSSSL
ncbi:MAG: Dabb family protein, partial [Verrucomicrobiales bacterium]|nr:Dabb family protein [Verrucomicrobiales bacterium]